MVTVMDDEELALEAVELTEDSALFEGVEEAVEVPVARSAAPTAPKAHVAKRPSLRKTPVPASTPSPAPQPTSAANSSSRERRHQLINLTVEIEDSSSAPLVAKRVPVRRTPKRIQQQKDEKRRPESSRASQNGSLSDSRTSLVSTPTDSGTDSIRRDSCAVPLLPEESKAECSFHQKSTEEESAINTEGDSEPTAYDLRPSNLLPLENQTDTVDNRPPQQQQQSDSGLSEIDNLYSDIKEEIPKEISEQLLVEPSEEVEEAQQDSKSYNFDDDISIGNNAKLRIMIDIANTENEEIIAVYQLYKGHLTGLHYRPPLCIILITDKCVYLLSVVHESNLLTLDHKIELATIDHILVDINYQGFSIVIKRPNKAIYEVISASENLTRAIISSLSTACTLNRIYVPAVLEDESVRRLIISKFLRSHLKDETSDCDVKCFANCYWQARSPEDGSFEATKFESSSRSYHQEVSCSDPSDVTCGMLMYAIGSQEASAWEPGYFLINDGYLYCYSDCTEKSLVFLAKLFCNNCKRCRRSVPDDEQQQIMRPYMIELDIVIDNMLRKCYLATSSESDIKQWMEGLLMSINIKSAECFGRLRAESPLEKFCGTVVTESHIFTLVPDQDQPYYKVLDTLSLSDITACHSGKRSSSGSFCYLMFEIDSEMNAGRPDASQWVFYFTTAEERRKFLSAVQECWERLFQIAMPIVMVGCEVPDALEPLNETVSRLITWHTNSAAMLGE